MHVCMCSTASDDTVFRASLKAAELYSQCTMDVIIWAPKHHPIPSLQCNPSSLPGICKAKWVKNVSWINIRCWHLYVHHPMLTHTQDCCLCAGCARTCMSVTTPCLHTYIYRTAAFVLVVQGVRISKNDSVSCQLI